jgi:hypothetical protein
MKVCIEKAVGTPKELKEYLKEYRLVTTDNDGIYCAEVVYQNRVARAFNKNHDLAVNNALKSAIADSKIS